MVDRRQFIAGIATLSTVGVAGCADSEQEDEPEGEPESEEETDPEGEPESEEEIEPVIERWSAEVGGMYSSPAVANGTVYIGSRDDAVIALDAADGTERWRYETENEVRSSPTVVDGTLYVGADDETVYALDADDGSEQWRVDTPHRVRSSPVVVDETVYIGSGVHVDGFLHALDADDGSEQWRFEPDSGVTTKPVFDDGTVYVGAISVYAVDSADGSEKWSFNTGLGGDVPLTVSDDTVFCTDGNDGGHLFAVDTADGSEKWSFGETGSLGSTSDNITAEFTRPTVSNGMVYFGSENTEDRSNRNENVYALDVEDGTEQWTFNTGERSGRVKAPPVVVDETVYVGSDVGSADLYALDAATGAEKWAFDTVGGHYSAVTIDENTIYVGGNTIQALEEQ